MDKYWNGGGNEKRKDRYHNGGGKEKKSFRDKEKYWNGGGKEKMADEYLNGGGKEKMADKYWNGGGKEKMADKYLNGPRVCKHCSEGNQRMIYNQTDVDTCCWPCMKKFLLSLAKDSSKSFLTVKAIGNDLVEINNPIFEEGSSGEWTTIPFYFVNITSDKYKPPDLPLICILAYNGDFDRK